MLKAINPKNQSLVNKAIKSLEIYYKWNDLRDRAEAIDNMREYNKIDTKCRNAFDKYLEYYDELPKNQQKEIDKYFDKK